MCVNIPDKKFQMNWVKFRIPACVDRLRSQLWRSVRDGKKSEWADTRGRRRESRTARNTRRQWKNSEESRCWTTLQRTQTSTQESTCASARAVPPLVRGLFRPRCRPEKNIQKSSSNNNNKKHDMLVILNIDSSSSNRDNDGEKEAATGWWGYDDDELSH